MSLFSKIFSYSSLFFCTLITLSLALVSCDRYEYELGKIEAPKNAPEYTYNPDINKSTDDSAKPGN